MKTKLGIIVFCAIILALTGYLWLTTNDTGESSEFAEHTESIEPQGVSQTSEGQAEQSVVESPEPEFETQLSDPRITRLADGFVQYNPAVEASRELVNMDAPIAIRVVEQLLEHYRLFYKENPFGSENFEITEHLIGQNPKNIIFIEPSNPALRNNELLDTWGTPYFFHVVSISKIEIYSAGPDQTFWTNDDIGSGVLLNK